MNREFGGLKTINSLALVEICDHPLFPFSVGFDRPKFYSKSENLCIEGLVKANLQIVMWIVFWQFFCQKWICQWFYISLLDVQLDDSKYWSPWQASRQEAVDTDVEAERMMQKTQVGRRGGGCGCRGCCRCWAVRIFVSWFRGTMSRDRWDSWWSVLGMFLAKNYWKDELRMKGIFLSLFLTHGSFRSQAQLPHRIAMTQKWFAHKISGPAGTDSRHDRRGA